MLLLTMSRFSSRNTRRYRHIRPLSTSPSIHLPPVASFIWPVVLLVALIGLKIFLDHQFVVTAVYCRLGRHTTPCPQSLQNSVQSLIGKPMLFYNFEQVLSSLRSPSLPFVSVNYEKVIPGTLIVGFDFAPPAFYLTPDGQTLYGFAASGDYTIMPSEVPVPTLRLTDPEVLTQLHDFYLDPALHQKILQLLYLAGDKLLAWTMEIESFNCLRITTAKATYLLDLFSLDENLQKLDYIEQNRQPTTFQEIDLRLSLPVVRPAN